MAAQSTFQFRSSALSVAVLIHVLLVMLVLRSTTISSGSANSGDAAGKPVEVSVALTSPDMASQSTVARHVRIARALKPEQPTLRKAALRMPSASASSFSLSPQSQEDSDDVVVAASANTQVGRSDFRQRLLAHISQFEIYPLSARAQHIQGHVGVVFVLTRDGAVSNVKVTQSSGFSVLDRAAIETVLRAQPLPAIPADFPDPLEIEMPIDFTLQT